MPTFLEFLRGSQAPPPVQTTIPKPTVWAPVEYDRSQVWSEIIRQSGGPSSVASVGALAHLARLHAESVNWQAAIGPVPAVTRQQLQGEWERRVSAGLPYDPLGFISEQELEHRRTWRLALCEQHAQRICMEAKPLCLAIVERLPALADKLMPAAEQDDLPDKTRAEKRGMVWLPSIWLRQLWQTDGEVKAHVERISDSYANQLSPAEMLQNCIAL